MLLSDIYKPLFAPLCHDTHEYKIKIIKDTYILFRGVLTSNKYADLPINKYWYDPISDEFVVIAE